MQNRINAIIVESDQHSRVTLKTATTAVPNFNDVGLLRTLELGSEHLRGEVDCDVVFISYRFGSEKISKFIQDGKKSRQGVDAAYILVLPANDQNFQTVAKNFVCGGDGFLCEPYSVDALEAIVELSAVLKLKRAEDRQRAALHLYLEEALKLIDHMALRKVSGSPPGVLQRKLQDLREEISALPDKWLEEYFQNLFELFENAPVHEDYQRVLSSLAVSKNLKEKIKKKRDDEEERWKKEAADRDIRIIKK